jgi:hypothetical protein
MQAQKNAKYKTMEYQKLYTYFYTKYYSKTVFLIKSFFVKSESQNKHFWLVYNEVQQYLHDEFIHKSNLNQNEHLKKAYQIFCNRHRIYAREQEENIFVYEISEFVKQIKHTDLPQGYHYTKLIIEIAVLEAVTEISRLMSNQSQLLEMVYKQNAFDAFEIRDYQNLALQDFPIYKKLHLELHSQTPTTFIASDNLGANPMGKLDFMAVLQNPYNRNHWNENCFDLFHYLVANYEKKGKIKYINIFYFLKNNTDKNTYAFGFTIDQYKEFIQTNFGLVLTKFERAEYEYIEKVIPILNAFEQDFRKTT